MMQIARSLFLHRRPLPFARSLGVLLTACAQAVILTATAGDWPRWRGPNLDGISPETAWTWEWPQEGPRILWKAEVGIGFSSVAVAAGRVYTLGNASGQDTVYAFDARTGKAVWTHSYACPIDAKYYEGGPGSTPTVDGDRVYTLSKRGHLHAFEAATGKVLWRRDLLDELGVERPEWGFSGSPLVQGRLLLLNLGTAGTAVDKETGRVVWTSGKGLAGYATPVPLARAAEPAVAIFSGTALSGVRVSDGKLVWQHPWVERWKINAADPIPFEDGLFISTFDKGAALLRVGTGEPSVIWANKEMGNHFNSCVLLDGYLYGVDGNTDQARKDLRCLEAATGRLRWNYAGLGLGSITAAAGKLIVLSEKGELLVAPADPNGFKPLARAQVLGGKCWTTPVLADARIYCRNAQGTLVCVDVARKTR